MPISIRSGAPTVNAVTGAVAPSVTLSGTSQPQAGDVLVIFHANDFYTLANMPTPTVGGSTSGVTAVSGATADAGSSQGHVKTWYYVVPSTANLTVTVAETGTADEEKLLAVYVLAGADITTVVDGTGGQGSSASTTTSWTISACSPATADAYLIAHANSGGGVDATGITVPAGMTQTYNSTIASSMGYAGAVLQLSSSGTTGTETFSPSGVTPYAGAMVAILTATAATYVEQAGKVWARTPGRIAPSGFWVPGPYDYAGSPPVVNVNDTPPTLTHTTGDPSLSLTASDTAPATTHQTFDVVSAQTTTDATAPALGHQTGDPNPSAATTDSVAPATTHQTFDATTTTTTTGITVAAELANHTLVAGDPTTTTTTTTTAATNTHTTGDATTTSTTTDSTAPANTHTTYNATVSTAAILNVDAPDLVHTQTAGQPSPALSPNPTAGATTHQTFDATISTSQAAVDVTNPTQTHTAGQATANVGGTPSSPLHSFTTFDPTTTQTTMAQAPSVAHNALDATVSTHLQPPAFVAVDTGLGWSGSIDAPYATRTTPDGQTSRGTDRESLASVHATEGTSVATGLVS